MANFHQSFIEFLKRVFGPIVLGSSLFFYSIREPRDAVCSSRGDEYIDSRMFCLLPEEGSSENLSDLIGIADDFYHIEHNDASYSAYLYSRFVDYSNFRVEFFLLVTVCFLLLFGVFSKYNNRPVSEKKYTLFMHVSLLLFFSVFVVLTYPFFLWFLAVIFRPFLDIADGVSVTIDSCFGGDGLLICNCYTQGLKGVLAFLTFLLFYLFLSYRQDSGLLDFEYAILIFFIMLSSFLLISSFEFISMYLSLEMLSFCSYILAAFDKKCVYSAEAGLKYFILGSVASGILLFGILLFKGVYGFTHFADLFYGFADLLFYGDSGENSLGEFSVLFILSGFFFKISAVPFHNWTPDVYEGSPLMSTAIFAIIVKVAIFSFLFQFVVTILFVFKATIEVLLLIVALISVIFGAMGAAYQSNLRQLAAYSSINHAGFVLLGLACFERTEELLVSDVFTDCLKSFHSSEFFKYSESLGLQAAIFYLILYSLTNLGFFTFLLSLRDSSTGVFISNLKDLPNLKQKNPFFVFLFSLVLFSLAGAPPLFGFFGKYFVLMSLLSAGYSVFALLVVLASVLSAFYYLRVISYLYFVTNGSGVTFKKILPPYRHVLLVVSSILIIGPVYLTSIWFWVDSLVISLLHPFSQVCLQSLSPNF